MRPFSRTIRRAVGDLVVEIGPYGIGMRKRGGRIRVRVSWLRLWQILHGPWATCPSRKQAFAQGGPRGWLPTPGETVWLPAKAGTMGNVVNSGTVRHVGFAFPQPIVFVTVKYGSRQMDCQFELSDLRPCRPADPEHSEEGICG